MKNLNTFADRLNYALKDKNKRQVDLANGTGLSTALVSQYLTGKFEAKSDKATIIADYLNVNELWLMGLSDVYERIVEEVEEIPDKLIVFNDYFPLNYSTNLSAGTLEELLESDPDAIVYVPIKYQAMKKRLHAFKVNGTSMNNVIADGSIVIAEDINHLSSVKDGTIVVAFVDGMATVKRIYTRENQITLMPDSTEKSHLPIMINIEDNPISIIGRVIWHMNPDDIDKMY